MGFLDRLLGSDSTPLGGSAARDGAQAKPRKLLPWIDSSRCGGCARCLDACGDRECLKLEWSFAQLARPGACTSGGDCVEVCPHGVIRMEWFTLAGSHDVGRWTGAPGAEPTDSVGTEAVESTTGARPIRRALAAGGVDPHGMKPAGDARWSRALESLRAAFEAPSRPAIRDLPGFLDGVPEKDRSEAMQDLIAEHLISSRRRVEPLRLDDYVAELGDSLPWLTDLRETPISLVEDEFIALNRFPCGESVRELDYEERFPGRPDVLALIEDRSRGAGRFVKLRKLGRGSSGLVWEAMDLEAQQSVALKELHAELVPSAEAVSRFTFEARHLESLDHPGIVAIHEPLRDSQTRPWYAMQLLHGRPLSALIKKAHLAESPAAGPAKRAQLRAMIGACADVAEALAHAHSRGVWHRDVAPGNVLVIESGGALLLNWASATGERSAAAGPSTEGPAIGTPEYMAPEQVDGRGDARSDVFSLGAVLHEVLVGRPPVSWPGGERPVDWRRKLSAAIQPGLGPAILPRSRALRSLCQKALARDPDQRFSSVSEMARVLRQLPR